MTRSKVSIDDIALPALLRHARTTYGTAMRRALVDAGYDDVPKNGLYLIGGLVLDEGSVPLGLLIRDLQISKQAAGQLVDMLVTRGYLTRTVDEVDRRKLTVTLSERGRAAAAVQAKAREKIDTDLVASMGKDNVARTRRTLAALIEMGHGKRGQDS
jgi:DNA-binding MarR family transcriptional regulator